MVVGFVVHPQRPDAADLVKEAAAWLEGRGHVARVLESDDEAVADLDLAVSLGGDGTMLRTVDRVAGFGVPVMGVNLGQLGYLAEVEPSHLITALERFLAGEHTIVERMRMAVHIDAASCAGDYPALNEAVVGKTPTGQVARLAVTVDGEAFTTYVADGLIVATPTGSTAYAWSAGGPIIAPEAQALLLTPVAAHMLFDRSLVLLPTATIRLEVVGDRRATVSVDGRNLGELDEGDAIECTAAGNPARLVTFEPRSFLSILKAKFGLNDR
jgi:NAD+ kinase